MFSRLAVSILNTTPERKPQTMSNDRLQLVIGGIGGLILVALILMGAV